MNYDGNSRSRATSENFSSMRPDPERYKEDFENANDKNGGGNTNGSTAQQDRYGQFDFREHAARTPEGEEFDKFRDSFENIADINDSKFTPIDADIPDASSKSIKSFPPHTLPPLERFNLEDKIAKNSFLPEDSKVMLIVLSTAFVIFVVYM